eukprot:scaffold52526_cov28-Prasinocladus_malaysianus.AAC.1
MSSEHMPYCKCSRAARALQHQQPHTQIMLATRPTNVQHEIDQIVVWCGMQYPRVLVISGKPVSRTWHDFK